jgi:hypothetical protein
VLDIEGGSDDFANALLSVACVLLLVRGEFEPALEFGECFVDRQHGSGYFQ